VPQGPGELLRERVVQRIDEVADVIPDISRMQILPAAVTGKNDFLEVLDDFDHRREIRERTMPQVIDLAEGLIGLEDSRGEIRQLPLPAEIGRHNLALSRLPSQQGQRSQQAQLSRQTQLAKF